MITNKEFQITSMSYTNKDFLSIYPELITLIKDISPRWSPDESNESDPGIVLTKETAFVADKLNYNVDKNILEAFLPSATQETSVRNLCELSGYYPRYYVSATTDVNFMYQGSALSLDTDHIYLHAFNTIISDESGNVKYTLLKKVDINSKNVRYSAPCIEGTAVKLTIGDTDVITLKNIDSNNRLYLPETMIAQNGVFIFNSDDWQDPSQDSSWIRVDNLNTVAPSILDEGNYYFKFGFDSKEGLPYIEFPETISELIEDGIRIIYIVTSGYNGNISAGTLTNIQTPTSVNINDDANGTTIVFNTTETTDVTSSQDSNKLIVSNLSSTDNGKDKETIDEAYNSFKKQVGTFNNLVTCRDYANAIYNMDNATGTQKLVSNCQVGDRRNDVNYANNIVTFNSYGKMLVSSVPNSTCTPFDLCIYPLRPLSTDYTVKSYQESFLPVIDRSLIVNELEYDSSMKTISHNFKNLSNSDIYLYKNYYKINVKIITTSKVSELEESEIKKNITQALIKKFNARQLEYGQEIPSELLFKAIKESDVRIKDVLGFDYDINPYILTYGNGERAFGMTAPMTPQGTSSDDYLMVLAKNILAGRIDMFEYSHDFNYDFGQSAIKVYSDEACTTIYTGSINHGIRNIKTVANISKSGEYELKENEVIQILFPNLKTTLTYPGYIDFRCDGLTNSGAPATPSNPITANTEYTIPSGGSITFIYTNTSGVQKKDTYGPGERIKATFNLYNTSSYTPSPRSSKTIDGDLYYTTTSKEQVEIRAPYTTTISDLNLYCFWNRETTDNALFTVNDAIYDLYSGYTAFTTTNDYVGYYVISSNVYTLVTTSNKDSLGITAGTTLAYTLRGCEIVLKENEYFIYTDIAKENLVILGSGTKLIYNCSTIDYDEWKLGETQLIDSLLENGLSVFDSFNWVVRHFNVYNLITEESMILTLVEGDKVKFNWSSGTTPTGTWNNTWVSLSNSDFTSIEYTSSGESGTLYPLSGQDKYQVRSRLDLNVGPYQTQKLRENQVVGFELCTNVSTPTFVWVYIKQDEDTSVTPASPLDSKFVLSSTVQHTGGDLIDVSVTRTSVSSTDSSTIIKTTTYEIYPYAYNYNSIQYTTSLQHTFTRNEGGYASIPVSELQGVSSSGGATIQMPLNFIESNTVCMFYVEKDSVATTSVSLSVTNSYIRFYDYDTSPAVPTTTITLHSGINVVEFYQATGAVTVTITATKTSGDTNICNLVVGTPDSIKGINSKLGLNSTSEVPKLRSFIKTRATLNGTIYNLFYYNNHVDNTYSMDLDSFRNGEMLFNSNNVVSKFVLPELDLVNSSIEIAKSSRK